MRGPVPRSSCDGWPRCFSEFSRRIARCEVLRFKYLADLHLGIAVEWSPLEPLDRLLLRLDLPQPEAGDQLLGLGEWAVGHDSLVPGKPHERALGTGLQSLRPEHHA